MHVDFDDRFWSKTHPEALSGCWLWHGAVSKQGYGVFRVGSNDASRMVRSHRHAYELCHGPIPDGMVVRHKCDVRACVNPDHLEVGTQAQNQSDMAERERSLRGERHNMAKLSEAQVRDMRDKYAAGGRTQTSLAAEYGVSSRQVSKIIRGKRWSHLAGGAR